MSNRLFDKGREGFLDGTIDWDTNTFKVQLTGATADVAIKTITAISTATPPVVTSNSHGFSNGDIVVIMNVVGINANGTFKVAGATTNTFTLTTVKDGLNVVGTGTYSSGGTAYNLTVGQNRSDVDGAVVGTDQTVTSPTVTAGVADAADLTWTALSGSQVNAAVVYKSTGTNTTDRLAYFMDGKTLVTAAADAASSATTLWVEPLEGAIASGVAMVFSNGITATTSAPAVAGARSISVSALSGAIAAGHTADVATTGAGMPFTPSGANVTIQLDNGSNKIFQL